MLGTPTLYRGRDGREVATSKSGMPRCVQCTLASRLDAASHLLFLNHSPPSLTCVRALPLRRHLGMKRLRERHEPCISLAKARAADLHTLRDPATGAADTSCISLASASQSDLLHLTSPLTVSTRSTSASESVADFELSSLQSSCTGDLEEFDATSRLAATRLTTPPNADDAFAQHELLVHCPAPQRPAHRAIPTARPPRAIALEWD